MGRRAQYNKEIAIKKLHSVKRNEEQIHDAELKLAKLNEEKKTVRSPITFT